MIDRRLTKEACDDERHVGHGFITHLQFSTLMWLDD